ncbi:substrate-binding domain-containing protein [Streptomyces sp. HUAS 31]|uniref:substrate-binding domain-containing protein n=1 Tax=Streptomyces sp. HUAS 31 TaxID=3020055 RepID=UPI002305079A|nr:substrate-binding domain-containing protein [Streptomyces sp. HUAS 31]WCD94225.1 substrate-binding domain-containing protein [Streptomyces sp. HUAS 31]
MEVKGVSELLRRRVSAIILAASCDGAPAICCANKVDVPVIAIDRFVPADIDQVAVEITEPTAVLVDHLASIRHTRIAVITGRARLTTVEHSASYQLGLRLNGNEVRPDHEANGDSSEVGAEVALGQLLSVPEPPTALVAGSSRMNIGAMRALRNAGLKVPVDWP